MHEVNPFYSLVVRDRFARALVGTAIVLLWLLFFFFQAGDGIRGPLVTGVQTCALPISGRFDGLLCVDALECVAPEHWPGVAAGLAATVRTGAPAYVTVELRTGPLPAATDPRQVPGE